MMGTRNSRALGVIGSLVVLMACNGIKQLIPATTTPRPTPVPSHPTDTPVPPTDTPPPTETNTPIFTSTPRPTSDQTATPAAAAVRVTDTRVIYHGGEYHDGVGIYARGVLPWVDLLVRLGNTWYGPEREPDDGIDAVPLPEGYRWECEGGFGCHPNGEAWWAESSNEGTARLIGLGGTVLVTVPLKVAFYGPGEGGGGELPTLTPPLVPTDPPQPGRPTPGR